MNQSGNEFIAARECAINYISYRMRSEFEVARKLKEKGYGGAADEVIGLLKRYGYVDDTKYCLAYINEKMKLRTVGKRLIVYELRSRGVSSEDIDNGYALYESQLADERGAGLYELECEKALNALHKKFGCAAQSEKRKAYDFLARRGFGADVIRKCLRADECQNEDY